MKQESIQVHLPLKFKKFWLNQAASTSRESSSSQSNCTVPSSSREKQLSTEDCSWELTTNESGETKAQLSAPNKAVKRKCFHTVIPCY